MPVCSMIRYYYLYTSPGAKLTSADVAPIIPQVRALHKQVNAASGHASQAVEAKASRVGPAG